MCSMTLCIREGAESEQWLGEGGGGGRERGDRDVGVCGGKEATHTDTSTRH